MADALQLPDFVKTVLITGAGGFVGRQLTQRLLKEFPNVKLITTDMMEPPSQDRVRAVKADLGNKAEVEALFEGEKVDGVFALHGIMSGGSEADFNLGYSVNVDSHLQLLRVTHAHAQKTRSKDEPVPRYVYISGLAVYGGPKCLPADFVVPENTPLFPETSYGVAKAIAELYVYDYARKGYLDARSLRLPTVAIRSGAPSSAASSFISGLIREPLQGQPSECPIAASRDDPALDDIPVYLSRTRTVIRNIIYGLTMDASRFPGKWTRSVNVPGICVKPRAIIDALEQVGGPEALKLVTYKPDEKVLAIVKSWPGAFDNTEAIKLGFEVDDEKTGFASAVQDFKDELDEAKAKKQ